MSCEHISKMKGISCAPPSTRRSVQFLAALFNPLGKITECGQRTASVSPA